jgi:hypothetical protein
MGFDECEGAEDKLGVAPPHAAAESERRKTSRRCTVRDDTRLTRVHHPSNLKLGREPPPSAQPGAKPFARAVMGGRAFLREHGRRLWWLHSAYALGIGAGVVAFAQRGFDHARWLAVSLGLAWVLVV